MPLNLDPVECPSPEHTFQTLSLESRCELLASVSKANAKYIINKSCVLGDKWRYASRTSPHTWQLHTALSWNHGFEQIGKIKTRRPNYFKDGKWTSELNQHSRCQWQSPEQSQFQHLMPSAHRYWMYYTPCKVLDHAPIAPWPDYC